jgi:anti-anti-sigma regulatory factor
MLRITIQDDPHHPTLKLEGKLVGPWVGEFRRAWQSWLPALGTRELRLDMRGVSFVDGEGQQLLREIHQQTGATFLADSPLTTYFADLATQRISVSAAEESKHA